MKSGAEQLDEMSKAILIATDRIHYYKQQDKMLQSEIKRLTRNERTHRLCTRGGSDGSRLCGFLVPLGSSSSDVREILKWIPLSDCFLSLSHICKLCYTVFNPYRKEADNR